MQVLKEDIKEAILNAATAEFLKHGYENSSIRTIARRAGITAGNLYRYFESKEELFNRITSPAFAAVMESMKEHDIDLESFDDANLEFLIDAGAQMMAELFTRYREAILIILNGSRGTRFEGAKQEMTDHFTRHVIHHFEELSLADSVTGYQRLARAVAASYLEGIITLLEEEPDDTYAQLLKEYIAFFIKGFSSRYLLDRGNKKKKP